MKADRYYMNSNLNEGCVTNIYVKNDSFKLSDVDEALDEFKNLRTCLKLNNKDPMEIVKGSLSFQAGNVTVFIVNSAGSYVIPILNSGLNKDHEQSKAKKKVNSTFDQLKVK